MVLNKTGVWFKSLVPKQQDVHLGSAAPFRVKLNIQQGTLQEGLSANERFAAATEP